MIPIRPATLKGCQLLFQTVQRTDCSRTFQNPQKTLWASVDNACQTLGTFAVQKYLGSYHFALDGITFANQILMGAWLSQTPHRAYSTL